jgi:hypothetical protein
LPSRELEDLYIRSVKRIAGGTMQMATKKIEVSSDILMELIEKVEEMDSLIETLEVNLDLSLISQIAQSRRDIALGKTRKVKTAKELKGYLASLG